MATLYLTDLDHTFLRSDLSLSDFSIEIWNRYAATLAMGIATARSYTKSKELLRNLHLSAPKILLDGAIVVSESEQLIDMKTIDKTLGDALADVGTKLGIDPFVIGVNDRWQEEIFLYPRKLNAYQKEVLKGYRDDPRLQFNPTNRTLPRNLKIVYFGEKALMRTLHNTIVKEFADAVEAKLSPEKYGGGWFLTLLHPEGDKAHAMQKVCDYLRIDPSKATVFGDSVNDLGMFAKAGTSVAVANALEEVKRAADIVLPRTNDEDAVAHYLLSGM